MRPDRNPSEINDLEVLGRQTDRYIKNLDDWSVEVDY